MHGRGKRRAFWRRVRDARRRDVNGLPVHRPHLPSQRMPGRCGGPCQGRNEAEIGLDYYGLCTPERSLREGLCGEVSRLLRPQAFIARGVRPGNWALHPSGYDCARGGERKGVRPVRVREPQPSEVQRSRRAFAYSRSVRSQIGTFRRRRNVMNMTMQVDPTVFKGDDRAMGKDQFQLV